LSAKAADTNGDLTEEKEGDFPLFSETIKKAFKPLSA
jgi:hypothetical protein